MPAIVSWNAPGAPQAGYWVGNQVAEEIKSLSRHV
jgi:hypothetical protein